MTINEIVDRVRRNSGLSVLTSEQIADIKENIYDTVNEMIRVAQVVKKKVVIVSKNLDTPTEITATVNDGVTNYVTAGTHHYCIVYDAGDYTSEPSKFTTVQVGANKVVDLSNIPTRPTGVQSIKVYRTKAYDSIFRLLTTISNDATTFSDTISDTLLTGAEIVESGYALPSDFFIPVEVVFNSTETNTIASKEIDYERYMKWKPYIIDSATSYTTVASSLTPTVLSETEENFDYDGYVCYTFKNTNPIIFACKPKFAGTITIYYVPMDSTNITTTSGTISAINHAFHSCVVIGATIKQLQRRYFTAGNEVAILGIDKLIAQYTVKYKETLKELIEYSEKTVDTQTVSFFNFLNDPDMLIGG